MADVSKDNQKSASPKEDDKETKPAIVLSADCMRKWADFTADAFFIAGFTAFILLIIYNVLTGQFPPDPPLPETVLTTVYRDFRADLLKSHTFETKLPFNCRDAMTDYRGLHSTILPSNSLIRPRQDCARFAAYFAAKAKLYQCLADYIEIDSIYDVGYNEMEGWLESPRLKLKDL